MDDAPAPLPIEPAIGEPQHPTRLIVNVYLVVGILILILSSLIEADTLARYLIGTLVVTLLAALAWVAMRVEGLSPKHTARLRPADIEDILLAVAAAPGLWILGIVLNIASVLILGYVAPAPPSLFPTNVPDALALMLATLIAAPLCEEFIFRGYVQRAYERRRIWVGIIVGGGVFALYHLRFQGVLAIIPVSFVLSALAWRTSSIVPSIALHAAYNAIATLLLVATSFLSVQAAGMLTFLVICFGLLMAPISLLGFTTIWQRHAPKPAPAPPQPKAWLRWAWIVPMLGLAGIYAYSAVTEVIIGRFPALLAQDIDALEAPSNAWDQPQRWHYTIQNWLGDDIGAAACQRSGEETAYVLTCSAQHDGYDIVERWPILEDWDMERLLAREQTPPQSPQWWPDSLPELEALMSLSPQSWYVAASWEKPGLALQNLDVTISADTSERDRKMMISYNRDDDPSEVFVQGWDGTSALPLPSDDALVTYEWPWRLAALPFELAYAAHAPLLAIEHTGEVDGHEALVNVQGAEPVWTPAGVAVAWKVVISWESPAGHSQQRTAWYASDEPHTLLKLYDGTVTYVLTPKDTVSD
jgi:membrane protease YdiL (CAAX protease family)